MKKLYLVLLPFAILLAVHNVGRADVVSLAMDPAQSNVDMSVNSSMFENSAMAGTGTLDVTSLEDPFGVAQITEMNLMLVDGLTFNLLGGLVTVTTQPGDITISMVTPGAGGSVSGGTFDQLGNIMAFGGLMQINDSLGFIGGNQTIDLSTFAPNPVDLVGIEISRAGDTKVVSGTFSITDEFDIGDGTLVPIVANGTFFASGDVPAVPAPGTLIWLVAFSGLVAAKRQRI